MNDRKKMCWIYIGVLLIITVSVTYVRHFYVEIINQCNSACAKFTIAPQYSDIKASIKAKVLKFRNKPFQRSHLPIHRHLAILPNNKKNSKSIDYLYWSLYLCVRPLRDCAMVTPLNYCLSVNSKNCTYSVEIHL